MLPVFVCGILATPAYAVDLIGYVPYYSMGGSYQSTTLPQQLAMLDEVRYFGLTADASGEIVPLGSSGDKNTHLANIAALKTAIDSLPMGQRPRLDITIGGAGEAAAFSTIAADVTLRQHFAERINGLLTQAGATSVDIDWEHPANNPTELSNYSQMLQRIKQEVGGARDVYVAITPERFLPNSAFAGVNAIDGASLMTYDLGWWGSDPENPNAGEHSPPEYVADAVDAWTTPVGSTIPADRDWAFTSWGNDTSASVLGVGLPFYGRNISNDEAVSYADLKDGSWSVSQDGNYYMKNGATVWIPGLDLVEQRVEFAKSEGLKNIIIWSLNNDLPPTNPNSMLLRAFEANQDSAPVVGDYDHDGTVGPSDYALWKSTFGQMSGDMRADGNGNGTVDAADYTVWRDHASIGGAGAAVSAPEPSTAVMIFILAGAGLRLRRRRYF